MRALINIFAAIFVGVIIFDLIGNPDGSRSAPKTVEQSEAAPLLKGEGYHCDNSDDYFVHCEGRVVNISAQPLHDVLALAQCFDRNGTFISSDSGYLEYDPLLVGQAAPYHVLVRHNPAIKRCAVSFKYSDGEAIPSVDPSESGSSRK